MSTLQRFHSAQDGELGASHATALAELRAGGKRSHWIWYVFPQLEGLGHSPMARRFGIRGRTEAVEYLQDPVLRRRLLELSLVVSSHLRRDPPAHLEVLMGSGIDAIKLVSSLTLFRVVSGQMAAIGEDPDGELAALCQVASDILTAASRQGYGECSTTLEAVGRCDAVPGNDNGRDPFDRGRR